MEPQQGIAHCLYHPRFQLPIFEVRSDGRDNFLDSLIIAGNYNIPEVIIHDKVATGQFAECQFTQCQPANFLCVPVYPVPACQLSVRASLHSANLLTLKVWHTLVCQQNFQSVLKV